MNTRLERLDSQGDLLGPLTCWLDANKKYEVTDLSSSFVDKSQRIYEIIKTLVRMVAPCAGQINLLRFSLYHPLQPPYPSPNSMSNNLS